MNTTVRPTTACDAEAAYRVLRRSIVECCAEDHANQPDLIEAWLRNKTVANIRGWLESEGYFGFIAEDAAGNAVGFALLSARAEVLLCYVVPEVRFTGVGKALLAAMESQAIASGHHELRLESTRTGHAFYQRNGFVPSGAEISAFGMTAYPMKKELLPANGSAQEDYEVTTDLGRFDIEAIHAFLSRSYWSPGVPRAVVERAIQNSLCFGVLQGRKQVGFGRVITDRATFAYLADVYILEEHRGKGLSKRLLDAVFAHPDLQGLRRMMLVTKDAHALYAKYGFKPAAAPERIMEVHRPDIYSSMAGDGPG